MPSKKNHRFKLFNEFGHFSKKLKLISEPKKWLQDLAGAWTFYSILPSWPFLKATFHRIARFAPWIGLAIGSMQAVFWLLLNHLDWPIETLALAVIALEIVLTGGIHLDGLIDTADGIGAGKERYLEAMNDSRVGAIGVLSVLLIILLQISALIKLNSLAIVALPVAGFWSRCAPLWAIEKFPYLRKNGTADFHKKNIKFWEDLTPSISILTLGIFVILFFPNFFLIKNPISNLFLVCIFPTFLVPHLLGNKLEGHTGDSYGATQVIVETIILLLLAFLLQKI